MMIKNSDIIFEKKNENYQNEGKYWEWQNQRKIW